MSVKVSIETVRAWGDPSNGSGEGTSQRVTYFEPTQGAIVYVIPGDGGGAVRNPAFYDPGRGAWGVHVETSNEVSAGDRAFFDYHVVMVS